jgi:SAM-dependent methyltransferase
LFHDHFSAQASDYSRYRPDYPAALFDYTAQAAPGRALALDVGCGAGQASAGLARHVARVLASDASAAQLAEARAIPGVTYLRHGAERLPVRSGSVDLVLVAQAAHWFDLPRFYAEVRRVLQPRGAIALTTYEMFRVAPAIDALIDHFYSSVVGPYWPPQRRHVEALYTTLPFPFHELDPPRFVAEFDWPLAAALGYVGTWSALLRYRSARGEDPLPALRERLAGPWGVGARRVRFAVHLRIGTV